jgi:phosphoserine aminotransferase
MVNSTTRCIMFENYQTPKELIPSDPRFGCGPSLIPLEFVQSLLDTEKILLGTSHRKPPFKNLVREIQEGLVKYFSLPDDYTVAVGNGGATFLFDALGLGGVEKKSAHFTCGEFSSKWFKAHSKIPWIESENIEADYGHGINPKMVEGCDMICTTLNETSTGVIISELPDLDENTLLAVDATSGGGQVACDLSKVDIYFFSPQKVFASEGGLFVAILSSKAKKRLLKLSEDKSRYVPDIMNWKTIIDNSEKHQTYNTPSASTLFFLNEQVKRMNKVGYEAVIKEGQRRAELMYSWAEEKSYLRPYIEEPEFRSTAVATIDVDEKINVTELLKKLSEEGSVVGIDSYRKLGRNQFRIALFYNIQYEDLEKLTQLLGSAIESSL